MFLILLLRLLLLLIFKNEIEINKKWKRRSFAEVEDWFKSFVDSWLTVSDETIKSRIENIIKFENVIKKKKKKKKKKKRKDKKRKE